VEQSLAQTLLAPLADAFMEVGVFVAILIAAFGWLRWRHGDRLLALAERRHWAPALGAVLGVTPGCAGAILIMPLYARGTVSFGGVVAALVATMGDSSWVLMAADPSAALAVHGILLATGLVTGYTVDALGISPALRSRPGGTTNSPEPVAPEPEPSRRRTARARAVAGGRGDPAVPAWRGSAAGVLTFDAALARAGSAIAVARTAEPLAILAFWLLAAGGILVAFPVAFQLLDPTVLGGGLGGVDPYLMFGVCGTAVAAVITINGRLGIADDSAESARATGSDQPFTAVLRHGAEETSFVIVWVAVIYVAWTLVETFTGFDGSQLPMVGVAGVVVGAMIGLVPGCAVQIVFTGLYVSGAVPFSTLVANAVSQDGDALLPLLASESRSALVATCVTTVPGLVVGTLFLLLA